MDDKRFTENVKGNRVDKEWRVKQLGCLQTTLDRREAQSLSFDLFSYKDANKEQASMPVFYGQHASRPWVQVLKELISLGYPLN